MFGFVTKAQLDAHRAELERQLRASEEDQRAIVKRIQMEWEEMFDRFRRLYARLSKRVADASAVDGTPGATDGAAATDTKETSHVTLHQAAAAWRARRGIG